MPRLLIYRIVTDGGAAPHISNGYLTLTICKPVIRKGAEVGDYVLSLVAQSNPNIPKKHPQKHFLAAYLFKVTEKVHMKEYEGWCKEHAPGKICTEDFWEGDCQYGPNLAWRPGPHMSANKEVQNKLISTNLSGVSSLISNEFAAWKSSTPHVLTDEEIEGLGLTREEITKLGIGQKFIDLPDTTAADKLIADWKKQQGGRRITRKVRRATRQSRRVRKQGK
jgi:hypothetical protein